MYAIRRRRKQTLRHPRFINAYREQCGTRRRPLQYNPPTHHKMHSHTLTNTNARSGDLLNDDHHRAVDAQTDDQHRVFDAETDDHQHAFGAKTKDHQRAFDAECQN